MTTEATKRNQESRFRGLAGEYRVLSELILRGHEPYRPAVDNGVDIVLENGLRIQVKTSMLGCYGHRTGNNKCYGYNLSGMVRHSWRESRQELRDWSKICDFFVFWAINEDRFFIVPVAEANGRREIVVRPRDAKLRWLLNPEDIAPLRDQGLDWGEIADRLGATRSAVLSARRRKEKTKKNFTRTILTFEGRWELLNPDAGVNRLIESSIKETSDAPN